MRANSALPFDDSREHHGSSLNTTFVERVSEFARLTQHKTGWLEDWLRIQHKERSSYNG